METQQQPSAGKPPPDDEGAVRTAVALAIVKARQGAQAPSAKEEALAAKLSRLKSSMATLVKLLKRKTAPGGGMAMLEQLLTQLTAETDGGDLPRASEGALGQLQENSSKRARTSQPITSAAPRLQGYSQLQLGSSTEGSSSQHLQLQQSSTQAAPSSMDAVHCTDPGLGLQQQQQQQQRQQYLQGQHLIAGSRHGCPYNLSQICAGLQEHEIQQGIAQASREAQACLLFGTPADAAVLQDRAASLHRLLETAHAVQLAAAALLACASGQAPLDAFCAHTAHQTILAFVEETLVCLPPSALRQAYIEETTTLLASCLLCCKGQQAAVLAADLIALLGKLLEVHAGQDKLASRQPALPGMMQVRLDGASAFLASALHKPQLGQLLLLCCSQRLDSTFGYFAKLSNEIQALNCDLSALANLLQGAAAQHESSRLVLNVLDSCIEQLPAWIACCGPSKPSNSHPHHQHSLHEGGQEQDAREEDPLVPVLNLAVQYLVAVYSRVPAARASSPLVATGLTRSIATLAASLQHAARFASAPNPSTAEDSQRITEVLSNRRAACLRLCMELRENFKPDF